MPTAQPGTSADGSPVGLCHDDTVGRLIAAISVAVAGLTARLLMWDQLALWAVTTGAGVGTPDPDTGT